MAVRCISSYSDLSIFPSDGWFTAVVFFMNSAEHIVSELINSGWLSSKMGIEN